MAMNGTWGRILGGACLLALGALFTAAPAGVHVGPGGVSLEPHYAFARGGSDDKGTDDRGGTKGKHGTDDRKGDDHRSKSKGSDDRKGDDRKGDDHGGKSKGSDDRKGDDHGGKRKGSDDRKGDDHGSKGKHGADDPKGDDRGGKASVVKVERGPGTIEVVYSNGVKEEIDHGRYERKNAAGKTIVQRPATSADRARLKAAAN